MSDKKPHNLFYTEEKSTNYRLFLDDLIHEGNAIHDILNTLHNSEPADTLEARINSSGGYVRIGQQLINVIRDRFPQRCLTIIEAEVSSMASMVFMAGDERVIYPHSIMMVHDVSMYLIGKSSESKRELDVYLPAAKEYFSEIMRGTMTEDEIKDVYNGLDYWFDAADMCRRGIATKVVYGGETIPARDYLHIICPDEALTEEELLEQEEEAEQRLYAINETLKLLKEKKKELKAEKRKLDD